MASPHRLSAPEEGNLLPAANLLAWYDANKRDLPWRKTRDPYTIWVSEIMLQQTQVQTVLSYFDRWMRRFPSIDALSEADEEAAMAIWQGLGYYRRCRMLLAGAKEIARGGLPTSYSEWQKVPGVGEYTAAAIASIAFGEVVPVVDGNVARVYARCTASGLTGSPLRRAARSWASSILSSDRPGDFNQALMELGATVCKPTQADCGRCPFHELCKACSQGRVREFPRREPAKESVHRKECLWIPFDGSSVGVRRAPEGGWWQGLWEFPRTPTQEAPFQGAESAQVRFTHSVTHHRIRFTAIRLAVESQDSELRWVKLEQLAEVPLTAPSRKAYALCFDGT